MTKPFTATAMALLVDEGVLAWDDPVRKHIPEFAFADAYRTDHTTIRDLLTHRAGMPAILPGTDVLAGFASADYSIDELLRDLVQAPPSMPFRYGVEYSQVGMALAGHIIERASHLSWADFLRTRLLRPLGMGDTYPSTGAFLRAHPDPASTDNLMGRAVIRDGRVVDGPWWGPGPVYASAGGIVTTAEDMARFMSFLLDGGSLDGSRFLGSDVIDSMFVPQGVLSDSYAPVASPLSGLVAVGLGWVVHDFEGFRVVEHAGANLGSSVLALIPSRRVGVFVSSGASYPDESNRMVSALKFRALEFALDLPTREWLEVFGSRTR